MINNISISPENFAKYTVLIGSKALRLQECMAINLPVPKFVAIPSSTMEDLFENNSLRIEVAHEAAKMLNCSKYVVRSNALIEDSAEESFAGQFTTKIHLYESEIPDAIFAVIKQAHEYLHGRLEKFSLIIQEYIDPDISGITFTRNPLGSREMVIEYHTGAGEDVVSGRVKPKRTSFYWQTDASQKFPNNTTLNNAIPLFQTIEKKYQFPQDIEWCVKENKFYIVQVRPVTTLAQSQYDAMLYLENTLFQKQTYYYEKTEITEIAPRPTPFTFSLLQKIYSDTGPIHEVYKKYSITYKDTHFCTLIGNEFFIDREKELKSLLPSYSYFSKKNELAPRQCSIHGAIITLKNISHLNKLPLNNTRELFQNIKKRLYFDMSHRTINNIFQEFIAVDYPIIFEINLLSGVAIKKLSIILSGEKIAVPSILNASTLFITLDKEYPLSLDAHTLRGNSLEISDQTPTTCNISTSSKIPEKIFAWWKNLPDSKQKQFLDTIQNAIVYNRLREYGRWLVVKRINEIRKLLYDIAGNHVFSENTNIFFAELDEVLNNKISESVCKKKRSTYETLSQYTFSKIVSSVMFSPSIKSIGVSSGSAHGVLLDTTCLHQKKYKNAAKILFSPVLSPDLTQYFDSIQGIVSIGGGLLSHLAIVAREKKIPVIVNANPTQLGLHIGDSVIIDGDTGNIQKQT